MGIVGVWGGRAAIDFSSPAPVICLLSLLGIFGSLVVFILSSAAPLLTRWGWETLIQPSTLYTVQSVTLDRITKASPTTDSRLTLRPKYSPAAVRTSTLALSWPSSPLMSQNKITVNLKPLASQHLYQSTLCNSAVRTSMLL